VRRVGGAGVINFFGCIVRVCLWKCPNHFYWIGVNMAISAPPGPNAGGSTAVPAASHLCKKLGRSDVSMEAN
jgi:hypothetical protein